MNDNIPPEENYHVDNLNPEGSPGTTAVATEMPKIVETTLNGVSLNEQRGRKPLNATAQLLDRLHTDTRLLTTRSALNILSENIATTDTFMTPDDDSQKEPVPLDITLQNGGTVLFVTKDETTDASGKINRVKKFIEISKTPPDRDPARGGTLQEHAGAFGKYFMVITTDTWSGKPGTFGSQLTLPSYRYLDAADLEGITIQQGQENISFAVNTNRIGQHGENARRIDVPGRITSVISLEANAPNEYHISTNDEELVNGLLSNRPIYEVLAGEKDESERKPWNPEEQQQAQQGIAELIKTEFDLLFSSDTPITIGQARASISNVNSEAENSAWKIFFENKRRSLSYQNLVGKDMSVLRDKGAIGDFLHFGRLIKEDADAPDALPSGMRIYVNSTLPSGGHIAAEVMRRCRKKGYEPHGKVWDQSTSQEPLSERKDRLIFFPRTQSQMDTVMESLREIQQERPEWFEKEIPLLAEQSDIPGVGIAEEPNLLQHQANMGKDSPFIDDTSFNGIHENLLNEAWYLSIQALTGQKSDWYNGVNRSNAVLEALIKAGKISKEQVIAQLKQSVRKISPKYHVSPDNFARNLPSI